MHELFVQNRPSLMFGHYKTCPASLQASLATAHQSHCIWRPWAFRESSRRIQHDHVQEPGIPLGVFHKDPQRVEWKIWFIIFWVILIERDSEVISSWMWLQFATYIESKTRFWGKCNISIFVPNWIGYFLEIRFFSQILALLCSVLRRDVFLLFGAFP